MNELVAAIGDDANFAATITGQLSTINTQLSGSDSSSLSSYLRSDTNDSFSGQLTFTGTNDQKIVLVVPVTLISDSRKEHPIKHIFNGILMEVFTL